MRHIYFLLIILFSSCSDEDVFDVYIEKEGGQNKVSNQNLRIEYQNVYLTGIIKNGRGTAIRLESPLIIDKIALDSVIIDENDRFKISASIPKDYGYYVLRLMNSANDSIEMSLRGGDSLKLKTSMDDFNTKPNLSGVSWSKEANQFLEQKSKPNSDLAKNASKLMIKNPISPFNIVLSKYFIGSEADINESKISIFQDVTEAFIDSFPKSLATKNFINQLDVLIDIRSRLLNMTKGDYMINNAFYDVPEIALNTPDNKPLNLSSLKGKYVLVDFWASWCGPCRKENPNVVKLYKKYRNKNFTVYSVSLDEDGTKWKQAIKKDKLIWPNHVSDLKGWKSSVVPFHLKLWYHNICILPD